MSTLALGKVPTSFVCIASPCIIWIVHGKLFWLQHPLIHGKILVCLINIFVVGSNLIHIGDNSQNFMTFCYLLDLWGEHLGLYF